MNAKYTRELRRNIAGLIGLDLNNAWYKHTCDNDNSETVTCEACEEEKRMLEKRLREMHIIRSEVDVIFDDIFDSDEDAHSIKRIYVRNGEKSEDGNADGMEDSSGVDVNTHCSSSSSEGSDRNLLFRVITVLNGFINKGSHLDDNDFNNNTEE